MDAICHPGLMHYQFQHKTKTCDYTLKRGKLPAQAEANNLHLYTIPAELSELNVLEIRLISLRIPFMKMALPSGKQRSIHGPAVKVPTSVCSLLPRLPSQTQMVPKNSSESLATRDITCMSMYALIKG